MEALKCDRCGKFYEMPSPSNGYWLMKRVSNQPRRVDLCKDCHDSLQKWMKGDSESDNH